MSALNKMELARGWASKSDHAARFLETYPIVSMLRGCYLNPDYVPTLALAEAFALTPSGETLLTHVREQLPEVDAMSARVGVAVYISHDEIYLDVEATDVERLLTALADEVASGAIRFPQEYGRILYDRFFEMYPTRTASLDFNETQALIADIPNATYQVGALTIGPLGPVRSGAFREFGPAHLAPLWHCSDPGCVALHTVQLASAPSAVNRVITRISHEMSEQRISPSEWDALFRTLSSAERNFYSDSGMPTLPWLLADGFSDRELRQLVETAVTLEPLVPATPYRRLWT